MRIKKGDSILVTAGKDKGKVAKVLRALPRELGLVIEGVNLKQKHVRPKRQGEKGQMVKIPGVMNISNVKFLCPKCGKAARVGYQIEGNKKFRICKKCKSQV